MAGDVKEKNLFIEILHEFIQEIGADEAAVMTDEELGRTFREWLQEHYPERFATRQ